MRQWYFIHFCFLFMTTAIIYAQPYGQPDRDNPGDEMIQAYMNRVTEEIEKSFAVDIQSPEQWKNLRPQYREQYFYMLGLSPMPEATPLQVTITGTFSGDGFVVDKLHYQSRPGLYVTANLYRPAGIPEGRRLPAVVYVCGHSNRGRNGNKTAYQSHGIWLARHGYICLTLDSLQLGEIGAIHHGTYREGRWWWHSRGYTPAGVECLNGIRGIDYLISRSDVDPRRIAVTGISGGGAATYWIAAADERACVAVPVSGMADLLSYIPNRVINGHCDCMFLYNTFQWPWARIAALIAPRPMMLTNSDQDSIFPMDANERVSARLERLYSMYGASDRFDTFVSIGGHAYRQDIRQGTYRFLNTYLNNDPALVTDSEVDLVTEAGGKTQHPIEPEQLRVFPQDSDIPKDELNTTIDQHFVPIAQVPVPAKGEYESWKNTLKAELKRVVFRSFPESIPAAEKIRDSSGGSIRLKTEPEIQIELQTIGAPVPAAETKRILLVVQSAGSSDETIAWANGLRQSGDQIYLCYPRGIGPTRWTQKNPPNFVERSLVLLGRTADTGRVWDILATAGFLRAQHGDESSLVVAGTGPAGILAAYAVLWDDKISGLILQKPPASHMDPDAPRFLNILRVCDIPDILGMLAPRSLTIIGENIERMAKTFTVYGSAGASDRFHTKP